MTDEVFLDITLDLLRAGCNVRFRPKGNSMLPTIRSGELIEIEPITPDLLKRGDIVFTVRSRSIIVHRITRILSSNPTSPARVFITRGDACLLDDLPFSGEQVLGRVVALQRGHKSLAFSGLRAAGQTFYYLWCFRKVHACKQLIKQVAPGLAAKLTTLRRVLTQGKTAPL